MAKKKESKKVTGLDEALAKIEKQFGKGAIMKMDKNFKVEVNSIPTGSLILDLALGVGGVPKGRIIEILGQESSGKTTLCLSIVKEVQKMGGKASYIDAEHALDLEYAKKIGVNVPELFLSQPDNGEQALSIVQTLVESNEMDLIVIDSVASLTPKAEIDGEIGQSHMGLQARLMSQAMRKLAGVINKSNTCVIFINQIRMKIGVMFGSPLTTTGGKALKFYSSVRLDLRRKATLKKGEESIGIQVKAKVVKNKVAPPFKIAEFEIYFGEGVSYTADILNLAIEHKIIKKAGAWFSYKDKNIGQGLENTRQYLKDNSKILEEIKEQILTIIKEK